MGKQPLDLVFVSTMLEKLGLYTHVLFSKARYPGNANKHRIDLVFVFHVCSYQRADPNFVMLTPNKEHLAEGIQWKMGERPLFESDVSSGNFAGIPRELRPLAKIL